MKYVITGTSSGLGFEIASILVQQGSVIGISRSLGKAAKLLSAADFTHIECDLKFSDQRSIESTFNQIEELSSSDEIVLILNAAEFYMGVERLDFDSTEGMMRLNFTSQVELLKRMLALKLRRIMVINSVSGLIGQAEQEEYSASKHALMGYVKSLAKSTKECDFDIMCINPGGIETELWKGVGNVNVSDFIDPKILAHLCVTLINLQQRLYITNLTILPPSDL